MPQNWKNFPQYLIQEAIKQLDIWNQKSRFILKFNFKQNMNYNASSSLKLDFWTKNDGLEQYALIVYDAA